MNTDHRPMTRVMALHALLYCERLFYLEEVEEIYVADNRVFDGRRLHLDMEEDGSCETMELADESLGLMGKIDCLRRRDGVLIPYEHKKGRSHHDGSLRSAWNADRIQVIAYTMLVEACTGETIPEARIRYHNDNTTVRVSVDDKARQDVHDAIERANQLRQSSQRPPVVDNEHLCVHCSLAPVCLPEEERLALDPSYEPIRLFPPHPQGQALHVLTHGAHVGRRGDRLQVTTKDGEMNDYPINEVHEVVLHGYSQISTQALQSCVHQGIGVHWIASSGAYVGSVQPGAGKVQRRIRQFTALTDPGLCLQLAKRLAMNKAEGQLRFLLRSTRSDEEKRGQVEQGLAVIRQSLTDMAQADSLDSLRGYEGTAAACYFGAWPVLLSSDLGPDLQFAGRMRRPPPDRINCLLGFGYAMLYKDVIAAINTVGLEPSFGFYHQPRSASFPLALDLMELFRVWLWDMPLIGSLNRRQWNAADDFEESPGRVWLSKEGRKKAIGLYEERKLEQWKHPVIGYSLSYARLLELEVRLLEKEWNGEPGLFARMRLR